MEFLCEILLELILEGSIEASKSKKVPKPIRYLFIAFIVFFFAAVIGGLFLLGILACKTSLWGGLFIIAVSILLFIGAIMQFKKVYLEKTVDKRSVSDE